MNCKNPSDPETGWRLLALGAGVEVRGVYSNQSLNGCSRCSPGPKATAVLTCQRYRAGTSFVCVFSFVYIFPVPRTVPGTSQASTTCLLNEGVSVQAQQKKITAGFVPEYLHFTQRTGLFSASSPSLHQGCLHIPAPVCLDRFSLDRPERSMNSRPPSSNIQLSLPSSPCCRLPPFANL